MARIAEVGVVSRPEAEAETETEMDSGFAWLFRDEYPSVVRTAYLILGDREAAEDVAQEAFVRLYARWRRISRYDRPGAWVRRVAIRLASRTRRRPRALALLPEHPGPVESSADPDLRRALLQLPLNQRATIVLHYLEDLPVQEVAEMMGIAASTAKVHLHRARKRLATLLGEETNDVAG
jgi:RNA polymerase sigma-70 factor (sigma-E family)